MIVQEQQAICSQWWKELITHPPTHLPPQSLSGQQIGRLVIDTETHTAGHSQSYSTLNPIGYSYTPNNNSIRFERVIMTWGENPQPCLADNRINYNTTVV